MTDQRIASPITTLEDGLILRAATAVDAEALIAFHADVLREPDETEPNQWIASWVGELMSGRHPTFTPGDFTIVETASGEIVSSLCLISQRWTYSGIPFGAGRIELVSTQSDYRRRGLVRRQMDVGHQWSAARGELVQGITGIPNFYRQFGYEMALDLGGGRTVDRSHIPNLDAERTEPYTLRPATDADVPMLASLDEQGRRRWLVSAVRDARNWSYEVAGPPDPKFGYAVAMILDETGAAIGSVMHYAQPHGGRLVVVACELGAGRSWLAVMPSLLRGLRSRGDALAEAEDAGAFKELYFTLGADHPLYQVLPERTTRVGRPYAWYLRVPDLPAFLRHVAPVLEERLAASVACGHTGELLLNCYTGGLRLEFAQGRLAAIEDWQPPEPDSGGASFPGLTLLQLIFGYRSLSELTYAFADCRATDDDARVILTALFPKLPSHVLAID